ncbi:MAG: MucB/RseB C-terminal domain-containing protein [Hydrogenophaga sp.]
MTFSLSSIQGPSRVSVPAAHRCGGAGRWRRAMALMAAVFVQTVSVAAAAPAQEGEQRGVVDWLVRMHEASRQRAYTGTLVVTAGTALSSSRIWHVCDGKQQMERIDTLTGELRTTLRRNDEVVTLVPSSKRAWLEKRESLGLFPELLRTPRHQIAAFYEADERGAERIAGHLADVVEIQPKDALRYGYRIWSEKKTGLVVKMQTLDTQGAVLEQVAFTELQLDAPVRMEQLQQWMTDVRGYALRRLVLHKTTPQAEGWQFRDSVPGFSWMSCRTREVPSSARSPMQCVFSDGLASVSLFVEPFDPIRHQKEGSAVMGASHSLTQRLGDHWLTAVGEVPAATLKRFAALLERVR